MSFLGSLFDIAMREMEQKQNTYERANEKAAKMSDEQLRRKIENSSNTFEKMGYAQEWKDRHGN